MKAQIQQSTDQFYEAAGAIFRRHLLGRQNQTVSPQNDKTKQNKKKTKDTLYWAIAYVV